MEECQDQDSSTEIKLNSFYCTQCTVLVHRGGVTKSDGDLGGTYLWGREGSSARQNFFLCVLPCSVPGYQII